MAEFIANAIQTVEENGNILYTDTAVCPSRCITRRAGSGIVRVKGHGNQRARYLASFIGNIQIPTGGTVGEILESTRMIVTPAAVENFFNVSAQVYVDIPCGCCLTLAVQNTSDQAIEVQNANFIVVRTA